MEKKYTKDLIFIISSIFVVLVTNNYCDYENSLIFGGRDGEFYLSISEYSPKFGSYIEYIKGERFIIPYIIGIISNITQIEIYLLYQILSILFSIILILLFRRILILLKVDNISLYVSLLLVIFNPYLIRYYIAIPTLVVDLAFIISLEIIVLGFMLNKNKFFYIGLILSLMCRQNGIMILFGFFLIKFFYKSKSIISNKDLIILFLSFLIIFLLNTFYAINSAGNLKQVESLYITTLFGILMIDYSFLDLIKYLLFPLLGFGPLIVYFFFSIYFKKFEFNHSEFLLFLIIVSILLIGIAFIGGPNTTGRNLIRLSNFAYLYLIIIINHVFQSKKIFIKNSKKIIIFSTTFLLLWSFHPSYSKIKIWKFLDSYFNF